MFELKVVVCAAGPNPPGYGFPKNGKPRCLYHYKGEVILDAMVKRLHAFGLYDIRVVTGWKHEQIEKYVEEKKLDVDLAFCPESENDKFVGSWPKIFDTIRAGLNGVDDDVIIMFGDNSLSQDGIPKLLASKYRFAFTRNGHGFQLFRFRKEFLSTLRSFQVGGFAKVLYHIGLRPPWDEEEAKKNGIEIFWTTDHDLDVYRALDECRRWALSYLDIDVKYWNTLSNDKKRVLLKSKGVKYEYHNEVFWIIIDEYVGNGHNYDVYGVEFEILEE